MAMLTMLSRLLLAAALLLFMLGGAAAVHSWYFAADLPFGEAPGLVVHNIDRDLGEIALETPIEIDFVVSNTSGRPMRIVGFEPIEWEAEVESNC